MQAPRILLVDDDNNDLQALKHLLCSEQYDVMTFSDPKEALAFVEQGGQFNIIISDHEMPGLNGYQLLSQVQPHQPNAYRMMLTAYKDFPEVVSGLNKGVIQKFLSKPWDTESLLKAIKEALIVCEKDWENEESINNKSNDIANDVRRFQNFLDHFDLEISHATAKENIAILVVALKNPQEMVTEYFIKKYNSFIDAIENEIGAYFDHRYYYSRINDAMFAIVIPLENDASCLQDLANMLTAHLEQTCKLSDSAFKPEFICGISFYPDHGKGADYLLRNALLTAFRCYETSQKIGLYQDNSLE